MVTNAVLSGDGFFANPRHGAVSLDSRTGSLNAGRATSPRAHPHAVAAFHATDALSVSYANADGDAVSLSFASMRSGEVAVANGSTEQAGSMSELVREIGDQVLRQKQELIDALFGDTKQEETKEIQNSDAGSIEGLPEYWNAENTSQRIVDFAVSFFELYEGAPEEYLDMIKSAIDEGFGQARDMIGEAPDEVRKLTDDTYELVMSKLDAWAQSLQEAPASAATGDGR
jgi:hypothetical protein